MNYCYITALTSRSYLGGVKVLKKSLDRVNSAYPFFALLPSNIDSDIERDLRDAGISIIFDAPFSDDVMRKDHNPTDYWKDTLFKLKIFNLTSFDKFIFLDADMIVLQNLDHLFTYPHMSCTAAGQVLHPDWIHLNSGFMVIEPNLDDYMLLVENIEPVCEKLIQQGCGFGDQDVITAVFDSDWQLDSKRKLPETYNVMLGYAGHLQKSKAIRSMQDIYVYHFTGRQKPWRRSTKENLTIFAKIIKRGGNHIDFQVFKLYKKLLKTT